MIKGKEEEGGVLAQPASKHNDGVEMQKAKRQTKTREQELSKNRPKNAAWE